ncbi:MAG: hypothetical protein IPJ98_28605 [Bryobacterales bacterium]|nr:hypothetical protein [Bryobacterales bacterium]
MAVGRRELLGLAGGAAVGGALSPVPWKLLDDSAIWTQNWSWTPTQSARPGDGEVQAVHAVRGGLWCKGPLWFGGRVWRGPGGGACGWRRALCPVVYGAHQLAYHPRRLRTAIVNNHAVETKEAIAEAARRLETAWRQGSHSR